MNEIRIYLDMDGTFADLYAVEGWLEMLESHNPTPYAKAKPMVHMATMARYINALRKQGVKVCVLSWLAKNATDAYNAEVAEVKRKWLAKHLPSVEFDEIHILAYGTPKYTVAEGVCFLVDDEERNRREWINNGGIAVGADCLFDLFRLIKEGL
jgi:NAD(P)-dependent dehydrogenase (short-subunit alcohol dehydrogenase family)